MTSLTAAHQVFREKPALILPALLLTSLVMWMASGLHPLVGVAIPTAIGIVWGRTFDTSNEPIEWKWWIGLALVAVVLAFLAFLAIESMDDPCFEPCRPTSAFSGWMYLSPLVVLLGMDLGTLASRCRRAGVLLACTTASIVAHWVGMFVVGYAWLALFP